MWLLSWGITAPQDDVGCVRKKRVERILGSPQRSSGHLLPAAPGHLFPALRLFCGGRKRVLRMVLGFTGGEGHDF